MSENDDRDLTRALGEAYRRPLPTGGNARERVLSRLRRERVPRRTPALLAWLTLPRALWLSPLGATAAVAVLLGAGLALGRLLPSRGAPAAPPVAARAGDHNGIQVASVDEQLVRFVLPEPGARRVSLVGDFNGWDPDATPMVRKDGSWAVALPLLRGRHVYAFVVDGSRWVADPSAPLAPEEGFGFRNSVVVVGEPGAI